MQTFLTLPSFTVSASCLDRQRLGKLRVEVLQLLQALSGQKSGWSNHPAAKMWRGFEPALAAYGLAICNAWTARGYRDTCYEKIRPFFSEQITYPFWFGDEAFHAAHRSNLLRKAPEHYGRFGWTETPDLPYIWPCN